MFVLDTRMQDKRIIQYKDSYKKLVNPFLGNDGNNQNDSHYEIKVR